MEAALVGALVRASMNTLMPKLFTLVQEKYKLGERVKDDIKFIKNELDMIGCAIEDYSKSSRSKDLGAVPRRWIEEVRELAHEIEDCVDRFLYDQAANKEAPDRFASEIQALKEKSEQAYKRRRRYDGGGDGQWPTSAGASTSSAPADPLVLEDDLVGMAEPRRELLELLQDPVEKLKVISVVGFGGLGKTLLAKQVYESDVAQQFSPRVWVRAADKGAEEVLMEVLMEIRSQRPYWPGVASAFQRLWLRLWTAVGLPRLSKAAGSATVHKQTGTQQGDASDVEVEQLSKHLREHLHNKRYFIVIDDMRTKQWDTIGPAFPADNGFSSRIMVTTNLHTIANACSSESRYVYKMSTLDDKCSKDLFFNSACCKERSPSMESGSEALLKKCDGLPLALFSVGRFLKNEDSLTGTTCQDLCANLGYHLEKDGTLSRMHRVLTHNYTCLSGHAAKACLLYLGMFPSNHRIRRKTLIRRWLAEGLVVEQPPRSALDVAVENFEALIDRNIIQPIDVSNNKEAKTCQPRGMMLEFIVHKSVSEKFITLFCDKTSLPKYARRLSLYHNSATSVSPGNDLSLVRSLTIFGEAGQHILDFCKYRLLRVLDLEECNDLTDRHLTGICNLLLLRYLSLGSLGGTITRRLPRKISKLKFLETLDVRRTMVEVLLPIEVIVLPNLIHLFGKFKLLDKVSSKIQNFFVSGESNLQTLAGFVTKKNQGLLQLMGHMKKLKKVKIWCESPTSRIDLSCAIQKYIQDGTGTIDARSLSLDFEKCSNDIMQFSLPEDCYLSSLKLQGELHKMPPFVTSLCDLRELCLSSTNLRGDLLTVLSNLRYLLFLKLAADRLEDFVIKDGALPKLQRLCFVVQSSTLPEICDGALPQLRSLHLLYKDLDGLHAIKIECIKRLMEVKIDCKVKTETRKTWEDAAKKHPNRPKILFMEKAYPMEVRPTENSVVPERPSSKNSSRGLLKRLAVLTLTVLLAYFVVSTVGQGDVSCIPGGTDSGGSTIGA